MIIDNRSNIIVASGKGVFGAVQMRILALHAGCVLDRVDPSLCSHPPEGYREDDIMFCGERLLP